MTPEQAVEAATKAISEKRGCPHAPPCSFCDETDGCGDMARVAIAAACPVLGVERAEVDTAALEATRKIEAFFAEQHQGGIVQRRAKIQCAIIDAVLLAQPGSWVMRREDVARLRAVCLKLRTALDALRPFPLVVEPVAAALIAEADAVLSLPKPAGQPTAEQCARAVENMTWHGAEGIHALTEAAKTIRALKPAGQAVEGLLAKVIAAWDALPTGFHEGEIIQRWLKEHMLPAIDSARAALSPAPASPQRAEEKR